ncbi:hypothetical protein [Patulibacter americanus]|uniref:hypothetical protein n=1 Tax=Patulibacter americanus TaxID=588672 RepID=UPI0003B46E61|nr:hypothetical protein [Patulibacter americanus]
MSSTTPARRTRPRRVARIAVVASTLACSLVAAAGAHAAGPRIVFDIAVYPADFMWDGTTQPAPTDTASHYGHYVPDRDNYDSETPSPRFLQLRGGAVVHEFGTDAPPQAPFAVTAGDVFRMVRASDGAVLAETQFTGHPAITSSVLGQTLFAGTTTADATDRTVDLYRRIARTAVGRHYIPTTYRWVDTTPRPADAPDYDESARVDDGGYVPSAPGTPAPDHYWKLTVDRPGYHQTSVQTSNDPEIISAGKLEAVTPTAFSGSFATPAIAGDWVQVRQTTLGYANDSRTQVSFTVTGHAGVVPPPPAPDATAPKVAALELGTRSMTVASFLKDGLRTFTTLDEPGAVEQQLQVFVKAAKKAPKKKSGKGRKGKKKAAVQIAAKAKLVVVGTGTGSTAVAGGTAKAAVRSVKGAKAALAKTGKTVVSANLVTVVKDAAGNATTVNTPVKLTGNKVAKATRKTTKKSPKKGKGKKGSKGARK